MENEKIFNWSEIGLNDLSSLIANEKKKKHRYTIEQVQERDGENNDPLLYSLKYSQQFGLNSILEHIVAYSEIDEICSVKNSLGENIFMAIVWSNIINFPELLMEVCIGNLVQRDNLLSMISWNNESLFHYLAASFARTYHQNDVIGHDKLLLFVRKLFSVSEQEIPNNILKQRNNQGETPLDLALSNYFDESNASQKFYLLEFIKILVDQKFELTVESTEQYIALDAKISSNALLSTDLKNKLLQQIKSPRTLQKRQNSAPPNLSFTWTDEFNPLIFLQDNFMSDPMEETEFQEFFPQLQQYYRQFPDLFSNQTSVDGKVIADYIIQARLFTSGQKNQILKWLQPLPINWDQVNNFESNTMFYACQAKMQDLVEFLAQKNSNFFQKNKNGESCFSLMGNPEYSFLKKIFSDYYGEELVVRPELQIDHMQTILRLFPNFKFNIDYVYITQEIIEGFVKNNCEECIQNILSHTGFLPDQKLRATYAAYYSLIYFRPEIFLLSSSFHPNWDLNWWSNIQENKNIYLLDVNHVDFLNKSFPTLIDMSSLYENDNSLVERLMNYGKIKISSSRYDALKFLAEYGKVDESVLAPSDAIKGYINEVKVTWTDIEKNIWSNIEFFAVHGIPNREFESIKYLVESDLININLGIYDFQTATMLENGRIAANKIEEMTNNSKTSKKSKVENKASESNKSAYDQAFEKASNEVYKFASYMFPVTKILSSEYSNEETINNFFRLKPSKLKQVTQDGQMLPLSFFADKISKRNYTEYGFEQLTQYLKQ